MKTKKKTSRQINPAKRNLARTLLIANALVWFGFAIYMILEMTSHSNQVSAAVFVGLFMLGNAGLMLWSGILLGQAARWGYYFALGIVLINLLYSLSVQFGLLPIITIVLDVCIIIVLVALRKEVTSKR